MKTITLLLLLTVLKARYAQIPGTDVEYAQGAIEKNDLAHREVEPSVWLIATDTPTTAADLETRLNASVDPKHGCFSVEEASESERRRLASGEITLQR